MPTALFSGSSNTGTGTINGDHQVNGGVGVGAPPVPRIQLLSNNVDNVNYYDDNSQVLAYSY